MVLNKWLCEECRYIIYYSDNYNLLANNYKTVSENYYNTAICYLTMIKKVLHLMECDFYVEKVVLFDIKNNKEFDSEYLFNLKWYLKLHSDFYVKEIEEIKKKGIDI